MSFEEFKRSLSATAPPKEVPALLQALWHDARGDWDSAHNVAQDVHTRDGSWIHAYLHRKEGDNGNAAYWYERANRHVPTYSLEREWEEIARALLAGGPEPLTTIPTAGAAYAALVAAGIQPSSLQRIAIEVWISRNWTADQALAAWAETLAISERARTLFAKELAALPELRWLGLGGCPRVTNDGLQVIRGFKKLQTVNLRGCDGVTEAGVAGLKTAVPTLEVKR